MKVCRRLERMVVEVVVWRMRPMPSLLAEPSHPRAIHEDLEVAAAMSDVAEDVDVDVDVLEAGVMDVEVEVGRCGTGEATLAAAMLGDWRTEMILCGFLEELKQLAILRYVCARPAMLSMSRDAVTLSRSGFQVGD